LRVAPRCEDDEVIPARAVVVDLDGVVWRGNDPIDGASDAITKLRDEGARVAFFTNNSFVTSGELLNKLARQAIEASESDVLSSAKAAATLVHAGERVLVVGGLGCVEALEAVGAIAVLASGTAAGGGFDAVVIGLDPDFTYSRLAEAQAAILAGARLIGTNSDATYPTPGGETPGGGAILAAVATASGREPVVAGKPHEPAVALVRGRLGAVDLVIGDRASTDGAFARSLRAAFGYVHSGVRPEARRDGDGAPDYQAADLAHLVAEWVAQQKNAPPMTL
jgi:HAD superfamily hydrolase (TIGR01450 family)